MIELPEAVVLARQIAETLGSKRIARAVANASPHKFAWYTGDPAEYNGRLAGKTVDTAEGVAGNIEIHVGDMLLFHDRIADLNVPSDQLGFGSAFTKVR